MEDIFRKLEKHSLSSTDKEELLMGLADELESPSVGLSNVLFLLFYYY